MLEGITECTWERLTNTNPGYLETVQCKWWTSSSLYTSLAAQTVTYRGLNKKVACSNPCTGNCLSKPSDSSWEQEGQDGPGSLTWFFEIALANFFFFLVAFREEFTRISLCLYSSRGLHSLIPCFIHRSKFQEQFWKGSLKENFYEIISKSDQ